MKKARMIVVGDEILIGQIVDTNSSTAAKLLGPRGIRFASIRVVPDVEEDIISALREATDADLVIVSGGLGPTHDDRTRFAVAKFLGGGIQIREEALSELRAMYEKAGRKMSEANHVQAMIPDGADYLTNQVGTAPGIHFRLDRTLFYCFQGVPREFRWMMETYVVPTVGDGSKLSYETLRTFGIPESNLYQYMKELVDEWEPDFEVAFLPQLESGVDIWLTSRHADADLSGNIDRLRRHLETKYPTSVYATGAVTMEEIIGRILTERKLTLATAESCTGGLISHRITNVSGSSLYFMRGVTAYSNESKTDQLKVPEETIRQFGAVSEETVRAMADGVRKTAGTDIGLATTGIAGPTGGTPEKPVGLLYVGLSTPEGTSSLKGMPLPFQVDRINFKQRASQIALNMLRQYLVNL